MEMVCSRAAVSHVLLTFLYSHKLGKIICNKNIFVLWHWPFLLNTSTTPNYLKVIRYSYKRKEFDLPERGGMSLVEKGLYEPGLWII